MTILEAEIPHESEGYLRTDRLKRAGRDAALEYI